MAAYDRPQKRQVPHESVKGQDVVEELLEQAKGGKLNKAAMKRAASALEVVNEGVKIIGHQAKEGAGQTGGPGALYAFERKAAWDRTVAAKAKCRLTVVSVGLEVQRLQRVR